MTRHKQFLNGSGRSSAAKYFTEHLSVSEYYREGAGRLEGNTFAYIGMKSREIDLDRFRALEENRHPESGENLTPRTKGVRKEWTVSKGGKAELVEVPNRRTGMDLTMLVPKTVSEVWLENQNGEFAKLILRAFHNARDRAMAFAETLARTQVCINGQRGLTRHTGNLLYLSVIHYDARPVGSNVPDPLLHAHNYIFNVTWDEVEQRLKAVDLHDVIKHAETIDAVFISELERGLTELGIGTERTADGRSFEVTSVQGKEIFCKRRNEILKEEIQQACRIETLVRYEIWQAAQLGKTLDYDRVKTRIRNQVGKQSAQKKQIYTMDEKLGALRAQMTPEIRESLQEKAVKAGARRNWRTPEEAKVEVEFSAFKNYSVAHEFHIAARLLRATGGVMTFDEALAHARSEAFIKLDDCGHVTTQRVKDEEERMIETVRSCQGIRMPLASVWEIKDKILALDQLRAVNFILKSPDVYMDVSGIAGAGKTTLIKEVYKALKAQGLNVIFLAPTSASEKKLQEDFSSACTLQKFEEGIAAGQMGVPRGTIIMLDEASIVSVPQMTRLVELVHANRCRLVTFGDSKQHVSPERGDAIRILQESGAIRSVELIETYRSKVKHLKQVVIDLKAGGKRREWAYERLNVHGDIIESQDMAEMREAAIRAHAEALAEGHVSLLACPIHSECRAVAEIVRQRLKDEGKIGREDHRVLRLQRVDVEGPELRDPRHYVAGRIVIFRSKVGGGFKIGQKFEICSMDGDQAVLKDTEGYHSHSRKMDISADAKWNIYDVEELLVSVGDQIRITEGFRYGTDRFKNNDIAKIKGVITDSIGSEPRIILDDGREVPAYFTHIDQGYCVTSYATQCRTVRQIVVLAPILSFAEMTAKTFYVLVSRASHSVKIFTDCKEALKEAVLRTGDRQAVWDYRNAIGSIGRSAPIPSAQREFDPRPDQKNIEKTLE